MPNGLTQDLAEGLFKTTAPQTSDDDAACAAQQLLRDAGALQRFRALLVERSNRIVNQITPFVTGPRVLDYGCGDGEVGRLLSEREPDYSVSVCDVMDYRTEASRRLPWHLLNDGARPLQEMDSVLLLTVLHHCEDPYFTLRRVKAVRPRRVVTIESVYDLGEHEVTRGKYVETCMTADASQWLRLSVDEQFRYACFWDWFYNKVVNGGVIVPYNYCSPDQWQFQLRAYGYHETERIYLGIDQPIVPEFHVLQVFDIVA